MPATPVTVTINLGTARALAEFCGRAFEQGVAMLSPNDEGALRALAHLTAGPVYGNPLGDILRSLNDDADTEDTLRSQKAHDALLAAYKAHAGGKEPIGTNIGIVQCLSSIADPDADPAGSDFRWWAKILTAAADHLDETAAGPSNGEASRE